MNVVCPLCKSQTPASLSGTSSRCAVICKKCKTDFTCNLVRIRAKRSRGISGITSLREFDIRVIEASGEERLIQFVNAEYGDFELRSKDEAILTYRNQQLCLVQNLTIGLFYQVKQPNEGKAWLIAIIVVTAILLLLMFSHG